MQEDNQLIDPALMDRVIRTLAETQKIEPASVSADATFEELNIDSLDGINIMFALENEFAIQIPDESVRTVKTVRELAAGVQQLVREKAG